MSLKITTSNDSGRTLYGTVQQVTASGSLGDIWSVVGATWAPNPSTADRKIILTEGSGVSVGSYTGGVASIPGYSGGVVVRIHDANLADATIGLSYAELASGVELSPFAGDVSGVPAAVRAELAANPVPSSNMRGTDNALLAASYTAPNNAGITTIIASSAAAATNASNAQIEAAAAKTAAQSVDTKLTSGRATKIDFLDAAITSRSSHNPAAVRAELAANPVPASNMRGTDNALLAASYTAPNNASIVTAAADALAAKTASQSVDAKLTSPRAGYLDNLSAGAMATQASVNALTNSTSIKLVGPSEGQVPSSGSNIYTVDLFLYNASGNMEAPDSTPTFTAENQSGVSRSGNLGAVTNPGVGQYRTSYAVSSGHAIESIVIRASAVEGGGTRIATHVMPVVSVLSTSGAFTSTDRAQLQSLYNKLPSKAFLTGTAASDGDINLDECDGSRTPFKADVSALATTAQVNGIPLATQTFVNANGGIMSSNMRGTDNALLAASYVAPNNAGITTAATQATNAAIYAQGAETQATTAATNSVAIKAKTDLLPADPSSVTDIPTAAQIATQVNSTLQAAHGTGQWDASSDATSAKQDQIISALGAIIPSPPSSTQFVAEQRTWMLDVGGEDSTAPNIILLPAGTTAILAMDFSALLNAGTGISAINSVTDISGNGLVPTNLNPSQDRQKAHFQVASLVADKRYVLKVTVATSDGGTYVGKGTLRAT